MLLRFRLENRSALLTLIFLPHLLQVLGGVLTRSWRRIHGDSLAWLLGEPLFSAAKCSLLVVGALHDLLFNCISIVICARARSNHFLCALLLAGVIVPASFRTLVLKAILARRKTDIGTLPRRWLDGL